MQQTDSHDPTASFHEPAFHGQDARRLVESIMADTRTRHIGASFLPDRDAVIEVVEKLRWLLFPGFCGPRELSEATLPDYVMKVMGEAGRIMVEQVAGALRYAQEARGRSTAPREAENFQDKAAQVVASFLSRLPAIRRMLSLDVLAAFDGDPAAHHTDEIICCYPGLRALAVHRVAHELYRLEVPLIARIMAEHAHSETGIDVHPGARIGNSFFIDHGTGVVIGETTWIGDHCRLYQGVTLGAKGFEKDDDGRLKRGVKRHPTLEDHVTVFANATILGGDTVIGAGSVINGGVQVTSSVPPGHVVRGPKADITLRGNPDMPPVNFSI